MLPRSLKKAMPRRAFRWIICIQMLSFSVTSFFFSVQLLSDFGMRRALHTVPHHPRQSDRFNQWLVHHPNTTGARLVSLMKRFMHMTPTSEGERTLACSEKNYAVCFAGIAHSNRSETTARMPLTNVSVFQLRRYAQNKEIIQNLGTEPACLPLLLAGAAVRNHGVVVELGPYLGLTSRCLGLGLNTTNQQGRFHVFDTFEGAQNYKAITNSMPWTKTENPFFAEDNNSFLWLWEKAVLDIYPTVKVHPGWIKSNLVRPSTWGDQKISLLVIDSIKRWKSWKEQLGGLGDTFLTMGSVFAAMDFLYTDQPNFVYSCLREFMQPVYTSWCRGEHWIFVVTKTIPHDEAAKCMKRILHKGSVPDQLVLDRIRNQVKKDLRYMQNLGRENIVHEYLDEQSHCLQDSMFRWKLNGNPESERFWKRFRHGYRASVRQLI